MENETVEFLKWCNTPVYKGSGEIGYRLRACPQFPEYNTYLIIDETGYSVFPEGKFLTANEVYKYWQSTKIEKYKPTGNWVHEQIGDNGFMPD